MPSSVSHTIVIAVCHPDDEAVWCGGLLCELSRFAFIKVYVICLSGKDARSPREVEFETARREAGYAGGVVLGGPLRSAQTPLPDTGATLAAGLSQLGLRLDDISLLITHAPYGDEHLNPHHIQAHSELKAWSIANRVPFGFFSAIQMPLLCHRSILRDLRQRGTLRLLQAASCRSQGDVANWVWSSLGGAVHRRPSYYLQFLTDAEAKARITRCYASIGMDAHEAGYTMFSNPCEAIYVMNKDGMVPFFAIWDAMSVSGPSPLVETRSLARRAVEKLWRNLMRQSRAT